MTYASRNFLANSQSSRQVHEMVSKAQGAGALGCEALSKTGTSGKHPGNFSRDMMRVLLKTTDFPMPYLAQFPVNNLKDG